MRLLFVCTGNICRSPTAEAVMRHKAAAAGLGDRLTIDSAGTRDWNVGLPPARLSIACAEAKGYKIRNLVARQFVVEDFATFDRIFAMDRGHLLELERLKPGDSTATLRMFLQDGEVADPFGRARADYDRCLDLIEQGSDAILEELRDELTSVP